MEQTHVYPPQIAKDLPQLPSSISVERVSLTTVLSRSGREVLVTVAPPAQPTPPNPSKDLVNSGLDDEGWEVVDSVDGPPKRSKTPVPMMRPPVDIVLVIDTSSTMSMDAHGSTAKSRLRLLDVVRQACKKLISTMNEDDRVAIVKFDERATTLSTLANMDEAGRNTVISRLEGLRPFSNKNLGNALVVAVGVLNDESDSPQSALSGYAGVFKDGFAKFSDVPLGTDSVDEGDPRGVVTRAIRSMEGFPQDEKGDTDHTRMRSIFVFTDGHSLGPPPQGRLRRHLDTLDPSKTDFSIHTFGLGYPLNSSTLYDIANIGNGTFSYIPDIRTALDAVAHAMANLYTTFAPNVVLQVEPSGMSPPDKEMVWFSDSLEIDGGMDYLRKTRLTVVALGPLLYGQQRHVLIRLPTKLERFCLKLSIKYRRNRGQHTVTTAATVHPIHPAFTRQPLPIPQSIITYHTYRLMFTHSALLYRYDDKQAIAIQPGGHTGIIAMPLSKRLQGIASLIRSTVTEAKKVGDDEDALDDALKLAEDIEERLLPAVGDTMVFNRRGRHVLLSLARSHLLQQCGNSGSGSLQLYGGISPFFVEQRDVLLKAFET